MKTSGRKGGMDFDLRQLEIFCKVVELGSFSKAAEAVHLAQASVSERVATLERMVGTKLLDRIGREIVPNKAGELLYKRALKHLEIKRQTCLEFEEFLGVRKGEIEIGASTIPGEYILPGVIRLFRESYPDITVRLRIGDSHEISIKVSDGEFELGVVGSKGKVKGLVHKELWKDELVLVVSSSHRWARKKSISLEDLCKEPFILREAGSGTRRMLEQRLKKSHAIGLDAFQVISQLGSSTAVKEGIKQDLGVSIISSRAVEAAVKAGSLRIVLMEDLSLPRSFYLIRDRRRTVSPLSRVFSDFLESEVSKT
jgi:DNA-binding transcriptional LysR family regulator